MKEETVYLASNEMPPRWYFEKLDKLCHSISTKDKVIDLMNWNTVMFIYINKEFVPMSKDDKDRTMEEFSYFFKTDI